MTTTPVPIVIPLKTFEEILDLAIDGELEIDRMKEVYKNASDGEETKLTNGGLIAAMCLTADDDDELLLTSMRQVEANGYEVSKIAEPGESTQA